MALNGSTKSLFEDPAIDRLLAMVISLGAEVAALREELDSLHCLVVDKGVVSAEEIANFIPPAASQARRDRQREALVANLLFPLEQACEALVAQTGKEGEI
jgi:hypothetical protein